MNRPIQVVETFVSLQGEGPSIGEPALFLRLANCNLSCAWCDTRHSWDWETYDKDTEVEDVPRDALRDRILNELPREVHLLVVTGGEPLLQQQHITPVLTEVRTARPDLRIEIETNGTVAPSAELRDLVHLFVVSPKLANSHTPAKRRLRTSALAALSATNLVLKFVAETPADIQEAVDVADAHGFSRQQVWVMPQTVSAETQGPQLAELAPTAIRMGVRLTPRLQILAWGDTRGT